MKFRLAPFFLAATLLAADPAVEKAKKQLSDKQFDDAVATLEAARKAKPKSAEVQKALIDAHLTAGDHFMNNPTLPPRMKYPAALMHYRSVVKYDPKNKKALDNIATIEGIYKSMGRPVPQ